ncbi:hypothetical protein HAX54_046276 [Datura stramonium]|uniref:Major facilitator superfamily (MFS) profile domain-containing protein n=1 Tax=Datura stramonium TaxID=4076 RepID=A0ABS8WGR0_DATST|nr:hypothetical protein [Datura stramonium]
MEGGPHKSSKTEFTECWRTSWKTPYIMRLAFSAGIGGLLFGYDTAESCCLVMNLWYCCREACSLQETIVSMAVAGAIFGAGFGGWLNDKFRSWNGFHDFTTLYLRSITARIRGALVSTNGLLITGGQFLSYLINLAFTRTKGTWRWMLGVAGIPAVVQFFLMLSLPESPRWLYRANKKDEARAILEKIYPAHEVEDEMKALEDSIETEKADAEFLKEVVFFQKSRVLGVTPLLSRGLYAGITVQVAQQFVGINTVMYYSPTIVREEEVDDCLHVVITCLVILSVLFMQASSHAPQISAIESNHFGSNSTCSAFLNAPGASSWNCMSCLQASSDCAFCSNGDNKKEREWYTKVVLTKLDSLPSVASRIVHHILLSWNREQPRKWIVNSEIYPVKRYRGIGGGMAAVSNWVSNLIVSEAFLTLTEAIGSAGTFLLFAGFSTIGLITNILLVPETKTCNLRKLKKNA